MWKIKIRFVKFRLELSRNDEELQAPEVKSAPFYELVTSPKHEEVKSAVGINNEKVWRKGEKI
jgi:hypothetical protein